jgi:hypothetical protein
MAWRLIKHSDQFTFRIWFTSASVIVHDEAGYNATRESCTMASQKVPEMLAVLHCNGGIYGNTYLITFKAGPFRSHTLAPSILPILPSHSI